MGPMLQPLVQPLEILDHLLPVRSVQRMCTRTNTVTKLRDEACPTEAEAGFLVRLRIEESPASDYIQGSKSRVPKCQVSQYLGIGSG